MSAVRRFFLSSLFLLGACAKKTPEPGPEPAPAAQASAPAEASEKAETPAKDPKVATISVIGISDFHGWLLPLEPKAFDHYYGGIANLAALIEHKEGLGNGRAVIVDNGDMWTGPTESTLLRGESVIAAYNELGVSAANLANHEFDFGLEVLKARISEAKFPFLSANVVRAGTDEIPPFLTPFTIVERDGVKVGIIGMSYIGTPKTTLAKNVADLEFKPYEESLRAIVPKARAAGAEVIVVLFHDTVSVAEETLEKLSDLKIAAVVAGQDHRKGEASVEGTPIVNPGPFGRSYVRFDIKVDRASREVTGVEHSITDVTGKIGAPPYPPSAKLLAIAEGARAKAQTLSGSVLGRLSGPLPQGNFANTPLGHLVVDAWLGAFPEVDLAICNHGALRQPLAKGPVTIGDLISVLPFENNLYIVRVTGKQLKTQLAIDDPVVSGITWKYRLKDKQRQVVSIVDRVGKPIQDNKRYTVLVNDFMYTGGDGYTFKDLDPKPDDTGLSIREPIIRMFRHAETAKREVSPPVGPRAAEVK